MWCENCKYKSTNNKINLKCLSCKWQYVGQEAFDKKEDNFEPINKYDESPNDIYKKFGESYNNII